MNIDKGIYQYEIIPIARHAYAVERRRVTKELLMVKKLEKGMSIFSKPIDIRRFLYPA